ncbi:MAG TPA: hypothetical protein PLY88_08840, partial [Candidatus Omnitrophota bacterium]|nr:hypothetical protein [Candidatus Omnitrophota bacterium]
MNPKKNPARFSVMTRFISLAVVFFFLTTSLDIQLATASLISSSLPRSQTPDDILYMNDMQGLLGRQDGNPLSQNGEASPEEAGALPEQDPALAKESDVLNVVENPLSPAEGVTKVGEESSTLNGKTVVTWNYSDGTYFAFNEDDKRIVAIGDFTSSEFQNEIEKREFSYGTSTVTVTTRGLNGRFDVYQTFGLDSNGNLSDLLESGYLIDGQSVVMQVYAADTITYYQTDEAGSIERIYERNENGTAGRLISFHDLTNPTSASYKITYDDVAQTKRVTENVAGGTFWVYAANDTLFKSPISLGQGTSRIDLTTHLRFGQNLNVYRTWDAAAAGNSAEAGAVPTNYILRERLENSGIGRVIKAVDEQTDLEYVYDDGQGAEASTLTILNYKNGTFLKFVPAPGADPKSPDAWISNFTHLVSTGAFEIVSGAPVYKAKLMKQAGVWVLLDANDPLNFKVFEALPNQDMGSLLRLRGPPAEDVSNRVDHVYEYDLVAETVRVYDVTHLVYATYRYDADTLPELLDRGSFQIDSQLLTSDSFFPYADHAVFSAITPLSDPDAIKDSFYQLAEQSFQNLFAAEAETWTRGLVLSADIRNSNLAVVEIKSGESTFFFSVNLEISQSILMTESMVVSGKTQVYHYDESGRRVKLVDDAGVMLKTFHYGTDKDEYTEIDYTTKGFLIYRLNDDGKSAGELLRSGFFDDASREYSLKLAGSETYEYFNYGADQEFLTEDDQSIQNLTRTGGAAGGSAGASGGGFLGGGGGASDSDGDRLKKLAKDLQECQKELKFGRKSSSECQDILEKLEDIQNRMGAPGGGMSLGGGGEGVFDEQTQELNESEPVPPPPFLPDILAAGIAPILSPNASVTYNEDGSAWIDLDGTRQLWLTGDDGQLGTADDRMSELRKQNEVGETIQILYDAKGRATTVNNLNSGQELVRYSYNDTAKVMTVSQTNGQIHQYRYASDSSPYDADGLISFSYLNAKGERLTQSYESGRLTSLANEATGELTEYDYDLAVNAVSITKSDGSAWVVSLGGDGKLGTADDFIVSAQIAGSERFTAEYDSIGRLLSLLDREANMLTSYVYGLDGRVTVETKNAQTSMLLNSSQIALGADGLLGSADDLMISANGFLNGEAFTQIFDAAGQLISYDRYDNVLVRDAQGRLLRADGSFALTEAEAASKAVRQKTQYDWQNGQVSLATYRFNDQGLLLQEPSERLSYSLGSDQKYGTADDRLLNALIYDYSKKTYSEQVYDDQGRVTFYKNLSSGDELMYTYDDLKGTVKVSSSLGGFYQIYQYDSNHAGDFKYASLIEEERSGQRRTWDVNQGVKSVTDAVGTTTYYQDGKIQSVVDRHGNMLQSSSGQSGITSVTDSKGVTTYYRHGQIQSIVDKSGNVLREYQHIVDQSGQLKDLAFDKSGLSSKTTDLGDPDGDGNMNYQIAFSNGVLLRYEVANGSVILEQSTDIQGSEFVQGADAASAKLRITFNDGRIVTYAQKAGLYEMESVQDISGAIERYFYYEAVNGADVANPDLDYSVRADGSIVYYKKDEQGSTVNSQSTNSPMIDRIESAGKSVVQYFYGEDDKIERTEERSLKYADRRLMTITYYDANSRVSYGYQYDFDGQEVVLRTDYVYFSEDQESDDFQRVKTVSQYDVSDLADPAVGGEKVSVTHYMPEGDCQRCDVFGSGKIDYAESFDQDQKLVSRDVYDYSVHTLEKITSYAPVLGAENCDVVSNCLKRGETLFETGEYFEQRAVRTISYVHDNAFPNDPAKSKATSYDVLKYKAGTNEYDFTERYKVVNGVDASQATPAESDRDTLLSVFRQSQAGEGLFVVHDFGKDFVEGSEDDSYVVQESIDAPAGFLTSDIKEEGSEIKSYKKYTGGSFADEGEYDLTRFEEMTSRIVQFSSRSDENLVYLKSFIFDEGTHTGEYEWLTQKNHPDAQGLDAGLITDQTVVETKTFSDSTFSLMKSHAMQLDVNGDGSQVRVKSWSVNEQGQDVVGSEAYTQQFVDKDISVGGLTGDWVRVQTQLASDFTATAAT